MVMESNSSIGGENRGTSYFEKKCVMYEIAEFAVQPSNGARITCYTFREHLVRCRRQCDKSAGETYGEWEANSASESWLPRGIRYMMDGSGSATGTFLERITGFCIALARLLGLNPVRPASTAV